MTDLQTATLFAWCGVVLVGVGLFGFIAQRHMLRRLVAFNVLGSGIFLMFGASAARNPQSGIDPVPLALIITGLVVALATTALIVALTVRHADLTGRATLPEDMPEQDRPE